MRQRHGFSLRELFAVVVVIAILAAIAIPAYIQAQVRTKLVTVKQDNRTLHDAIGRYYLDRDDYPVGSPETHTAVTQQSKYPAAVQPEQRNTGYRLIVLTTPYPYITHLPDDPFQGASDLYDRKYMYYLPKLWRHGGMGVTQLRLWETKYETVGSGPDRVFNLDSEGVDYDPSNGLFSSGDLHFYGPGFLESNPLVKDRQSGQ